MIVDIFLKNKHVQGPPIFFGVNKSQIIWENAIFLNFNFSAINNISPWQTPQQNQWRPSSSHQLTVLVIFQLTPNYIC